MAYDIIKAPAALVTAIAHIHTLYQGDTDQLRLDMASETLIGTDYRIGNQDQVEFLIGDSYQSSPTPYSNEDLIHVLSKVLMKHRTKLRAKEMFRARREIVPGAIAWKAYRMDYTGEPTILGQGGGANDISEVTLNLESQTFDVQYFAIASRQTFQEQLAAQNLPARINKRAEKERAKRDSMERFIEKLTWSGKKGQTPGVFENPWVSLFTPSTTFKIGGVANDMYNALVALITLPAALNNAESDEGPDLLVLTPGVESAISTTFFGDDSKYSVKQAILDHTTIDEIVTSGSLIGIGDNGEHGACALRKDNVELLPVLDPTPVPEQRHGLDNKSYMVAGWGGVDLLEAISHAIGLLIWEQGFGA